VIDRLGPAGAIGDDVEADHVFGAGKHLTTDLPDTRRLGRERRVGVDVEKHRPGQPHREQHVGQHIHRCLLRTLGQLSRPIEQNPMK
jgi:hypothetical protein